MEVQFTEQARRERHALNERERAAMRNAIRKLEAADRIPGFPHTSRVFGAQRVWELRPRAGRSRTRAFYRVIRGVVVIAAIGPEAQVDRQGFYRASLAAQHALDELEARP